MQFGRGQFGRGQFGGADIGCPQAEFEAIRFVDTPVFRVTLPAKFAVFFDSPEFLVAGVTKRTNFRFYDLPVFNAHANKAGNVSVRFDEEPVFDVYLRIGQSQECITGTGSPAGGAFGNVGY